MDNISVRLEAFEGPFDLLYHLIEKNEIDIYDIPISDITQQYIEYIEAAGGGSMEGMSEFIVMASTLLAIKAKMLLPRPEEESGAQEDPREELVRRLIEYKKFKSVTEELKQYAKDAALVLYKQGGGASALFSDEAEETLEDALEGVTIQGLYAAFEEILKRSATKIDRVRSGFKSVEKDLFTIDDKISYIRDLIFLTPKFEFKSIFKRDTSKIEVVVTFLALLELIKTKEVAIEQEASFGEIIVRKYEGRGVEYEAE